jgi:hypothetical protein
MTRDMKKSLFTSQCYTGNDKQYVENPEEHSAMIAETLEAESQSMIIRCYAALRKRCAKRSRVRTLVLILRSKWSLKVIGSPKHAIAEDSLFMQKCGWSVSTYLQQCDNFCTANNIGDDVAWVG